jgi:hypothetical protein
MKEFDNSETLTVKITCSKCHEKFSMTYITQKGLNVIEKYNCPFCKKEYSVRAALPVNDKLIKLISSPNPIA